MKQVDTLNIYVKIGGETKTVAFESDKANGTTVQYEISNGLLTVHSTTKLNSNKVEKSTRAWNLVDISEYEEVVHVDYIGAETPCEKSSVDAFLFGAGTVLFLQGVIWILINLTKVVINL